MAPSFEPQILEEEEDDFDPKTEDINQYCKIIGLDPVADPELVWIAKEGIMAKLPSDWKAVNQEGYGLYYFNFKTGQSIWEHPNDEYYRGKVRQEKSKKKGGVRASFELPVPVIKPTVSKSPLIKVKSRRAMSPPPGMNNLLPTPPGVPKSSEYSSPRHKAFVQKSISVESLKSCSSTSSKTLTPIIRKKQTSKTKIQESKTDVSITASLEQFENDVFDSITNSYSEFTSQDHDINSNKQEQDDSSNETDLIENIQSDNGSKLNPLKTSRSMSSIGDVDDLLRSSNESFGRLGPKKPVLGSESKDDSDYSESSSDDGESGDVNNIQMDIGDLTPAKESVKTPPGDHFDIDVSLTESSDVHTPSKSHSQSQSVTKSSSLGGTRFLKKLPVKAEHNSVSESSNGLSASKQSQSYTSVTSSVKKIPSKAPQSSKKQNSSRASEIPSISVQIEKKRIEEEAKIEQELRNIQLKLQEQRQDKYNQLMEEHDNELMRIQNSIQELTENQKQESYGELESIKKKFVDDKEKIVKEETERHERDLTETLEKLTSEFSKERTLAIENEERKIRAERLRIEDNAEKQFKLKSAEIRAEIEANDNKRLKLLQTQLTKQKYETQKLQEQDKDLFDKLRKSRHEIEDQHKAELLEMQDAHEKQMRAMIKSQENEIKRLESNHLDQVSALHKSFEDRLELTKTSLENKRKEFDRRVEKWEADHSTRTMAWASRNMERKNDHERQTLEASSRSSKPTEVVNLPHNTSNSSSRGSDQPLTTKELDETAQSQTRPMTRMAGNDESGANSGSQPASLRLQEYLKSLEEKINSFQALSRSSEPDFTSTKKPASNESRFNSVTGVYSSERWRSYYGEDYKYIPAKSILNDRIINDYKSKHLRRSHFSTSH